jgi:galactonate dehydratase
LDAANQEKGVMPMKITRVETFKFWVEWRNWLFVKVSTDEGLYGWGEAPLHGPTQSVEAAIHEIAAVLIGQDPAGVERHWHAMYYGWRWRGGATLSTALAGLDIALWDLEGKRLGVPVYRLLGGPHRSTMRVYASRWLRDVGTPEEVHKGVSEALRRGFTAFKWTPFSSTRLRENEAGAIARATELMAAAREGAGPESEIYVDCLEQLSPRTAVLAAHAFEPYRPAWFEEPIPFENAKAMARLQRELPVPIATGERLLSRWEFRELLEEGGCKIIQPDLVHAGGITEVRKIASMADTYYVTVAPHNSSGPICNLATMHLAASIPNFLVLEEMENERAIRDELCTDPVKYHNGFFHLPTGPGLGTDLRMELFKERAYKPHPAARSTESRWH